MLPTFVIFLREGIEASMIVAILLAYLKRIGQRRHFRDLLAGVLAAFLLIFAGGFAAYFLIHQYDGSKVQTYFETATYIVAAIALTYMTFWMQNHARGLSRDLQQKGEEALQSGTRWSFAILAFQAVGREGLETMVFTLAIIFANSNQAATPLHGNMLWVGALSGLTVALIIAFYIYKLGAKINLRRFFQVLGTLLMVFAAGILSDAIENMQQLGWLPFGRGQLWNSSGFLAEGSNFGDALHSLLGYADRPSLLQATIWIGYIIAGVTIYTYMGRTKKKVSV